MSLPLFLGVSASGSRVLTGVVLGCLVSAVQASETDVLPHELAPVIVTTVAPSAGPVTEANPKDPRQPVPASDAADYLKTIPGFSAIRNGGSNGDPVLRGQFGSRIKLLVDGGEMIGACPVRMDAPSAYIAPENFDRLTVIKGPQTVAWGPGNSAGTVLFERDPQYFYEPDAMVDAQLLFGAFGRRDQRLDASLGNSLGYLRLAGSHSESDDYQDGNGEYVPSAWNKWNGDLALGWTTDADTVLELTAGTGDGEARYAGRSMDGAQFLRESLGLRAVFQNLGDVLESVEGKLYYNYADHVMDNYTLRSPSGTGMMAGPVASNVDRRTLGGRLKGSWLFGDWRFMAGTDMQRSVHRNRFAMGVDAYEDEPRVKDAEFAQYGVFAELTRDLGEDARLIAGLRVDRHEVDDLRERVGRGMMATPNPTANESREGTLPAGFVRFEKAVSSSTRWFAGVGHTERFPDYWELFSPDQGPAGELNAFDSIEPEKTTQLDLGVQSQGEALQWWASVYAGQIEDFILFNYEAAMMRDITRVTNVDASIAGAELGSGYQFSRRWSGDMTLAYAWGEKRDRGTPLPQMPPLEARFTGTYEHGNWSASALWRLVASQDRIALNEGNVVGRDLESNAGFGVLSLNGAWRTTDSITLSAGVDNLFDRAYNEHLNLAGNAGFGFPADTLINEPGRLWWAKLDWRY